MPDQLELFSRPFQLRFSEAVPIYWELEWGFMPGRSHKYDRKRLVFFFGQMFLHEITSHDITRYRNWRKYENPEIRDSSVNREHARLTRIFNAFKEWKRLGRMGPYDFSALELPLDNPGELIKKPDEKKYRRNLIVTPEMFFKFCDYAHPRIRRIATLAILTLLRKKDIQMLTNNNLNRALDQLSGVQSKTKLPYQVPATLSVKIIFNQAKIEEKEYICDFSSFPRLFARARRESDIYFQLRDLRRSGATQLLLEKIDIRTIQKLLGHADIATTEGYLSPPAPIAKEAGRKLESAYILKRPVLDLAFCEN